MIEQDYIMRIIKEMVRTILKLVFGVETDSPSAELLENKEERELLETLLDMVDNGNANKAEERLEELIDDNSSSLMLELLFYSYLNDKPDEFLEESGLSRDKIKLGLVQAMDRYGLGGIAAVLLSDI